MKKLLLVTVLSFGIGFGAHAILTWNDVAPRSKTSFVPDNVTLKEVLGESSVDQFITYVTFDGSSFHPGRVTVKKGNYLAITNTSKDALMWLSSDINGLSTPRGYAEGERLRVVLTKEGTFTLKDTLHPSVSVQITIVP